MNFKILFALLILLSGLACAKKNSSAPEAVSPSAPATAPEPKLSENEKSLDPATPISAIPTGKLFLDPLGNFRIGSDTAAEFSFIRGEMQASHTMAEGVTCSLQLRRGIGLTGGERIALGKSSEQGFGQGGGQQGLRMQIALSFDVRQSLIQSLVCVYRGDDAFYEFRLRDLNEAFGPWMKVIVLP